ncbi:MAG: hypothetical protein FJW96_15635 [Actinobacteria bacterium]|nr:hypothetical protein [Actinomycetota bacterium]
MDPSVWEAVFFLLALKIPIVFVGFIVWRAIRDVPSDDEPEHVRLRAPVEDTPLPGAGRPRPGPRRRLPSGPARRPVPQRPSGARTLDDR